MGKRADIDSTTDSGDSVADVVDAISAAVDVDEPGSTVEMEFKSDEVDPIVTEVEVCVEVATGSAAELEGVMATDDGERLGKSEGRMATDVDSEVGRTGAEGVTAGGLWMTGGI